MKGACTSLTLSQGLQVPHHRVSLACLPTPIHPFRPPGLPEGVEMLIKRDDLTGMQLSGNKVTPKTRMRHLWDAVAVVQPRRPTTSGPMCMQTDTEAGVPDG